MPENNFPDHAIDPKIKKSNPRFVREYAMAAWDQFNLGGYKILYGNRDRYEEIMDHVMNKQSIEDSKKAVLNSEQTDESWATIDWTPRNVIAKIRSILLDRIAELKYDVVASNIDLMAKDEKEQYYAKHKAKIAAMEEAMKALQQDPNAKAIINNPVFSKEPGDPEDMEELEMMMNFGGQKSKIVMEAEMAIDYVFQNSEYSSFVQAMVRQNLLDFGIGCAKDITLPDGETRVRWVNPATAICGPCVMPNFSDSRYFGEVVQVDIESLPFTKDEKEEIRKSSNLSGYSLTSKKKINFKPDPNKVDVLELEFKTWDTIVYENNVVEGSQSTRRSKFSRRNSEATVIIDWKEVKKYEPKEVEVWYTVSWVIGTNYVYNYGPSPYQKRDQYNKAISNSRYHFQATMLDKMRTEGVTERLIPISEELNLTVYKARHFKAKWIPYIINLDLDAMEKVAIGSGGEKMSPEDIFSLITQNFTAVGRRQEVSGLMGQNYKMVDVQATGMGTEYAALVNDLTRLYNDLREIGGLNEINSGTSQGERVLNYVANMGNQATNNALSPVIGAERSITRSLAKGVLQRLVRTVQDREVKGFARTMGDETVRFFRLTKDLADRMWEITLELRPTDADRQMLMQELNGKEGAGLLSPADKLLIYEARNLHQARAMIAHRIAKREKEAKQYEIQKIQETGRIQIDSNRVSEEEKRKTMELKYKLEKEMKMDLLELELQLIDKKHDHEKYVSDTSNATKAAIEEMKSKSGELAE